MRTQILSLLLAGVALAAVVTDASAQRRRAAPDAVQVAAGAESIPLTVNRRSWLDPGNSAPSGASSGPAYVSANTAQFSKTQDKIFAPDKFGNSALPGQPYVPGRTLPVVSFATTPNGNVDIDNVYHYQPY